MTCIRCDGKGYYELESGPKKYQCSACITVNKYAGLGSRDTPSDVGEIMKRAAIDLALRGYALRSGQGKPRTPPTPNTISADLAFEAGCDLVEGRKVIRAPTSSASALSHAAHYHPNWAACNDFAQAAHARNSLIMLGDWLDDPVRFVVCWTPNGQVVGGTGQALRIAAAYEIQVFNLAVIPIDALWEYLAS